MPRRKRDLKIQNRYESYMVFLYQELQKCVQHPQFDALFLLITQQPKVQSWNVFLNSPEFKEIHYRLFLALPTLIEDIRHSKFSNYLHEYTQYLSGIKQAKDKSSNPPLIASSPMTQIAEIEEYLIDLAPDFFMRDDSGWLKVMMGHDVHLESLSSEELEKLYQLLEKNNKTTASRLLLRFCEIKKEENAVKLFTKKVLHYQRNMLNIELDARGIKRIQKMLHAFTRLILTNPARYNAMSKQFLLRVSRNNKSIFKKLKAGLQSDIIENPNLKRRAQQAVNGFLRNRENQTVPEFIQKQVNRDLNLEKITVEHPNYTTIQHERSAIYQDVCKEQKIQDVEVKGALWSPSLFSNEIPWILPSRNETFIYTDVQSYFLDKAHQILSKSYTEKPFMRMLFEAIESQLDLFIEKGVQKILKMEGMSNQDPGYEKIKKAFTQSYQDVYRTMQQQLIFDPVVLKKLDEKTIETLLIKNIQTLKCCKSISKEAILLSQQCVRFIRLLEQKNVDSTSIDMYKKQLQSLPLIIQLNKISLYSAQMTKSVSLKEHKPLSSPKNLKELEQLDQKALVTLLRKNIHELTSGQLSFKVYEQRSRQCKTCVRLLEQKNVDKTQLDVFKKQLQSIPRPSVWQSYQPQIKKSIVFNQEKQKYHQEQNPVMKQKQEKGLKKMLGFFQKKGYFANWSLDKFCKICKSESTFVRALKNDKKPSLNRLFKPQKLLSEKRKTPKSIIFKTPKK